MLSLCKQIVQFCFSSTEDVTLEKGWSASVYGKFEIYAVLYMNHINEQIKIIISVHEQIEQECPNTHK